MKRAADAGDLARFRREAALFLAMGRDLDALLGTRHEFLLGRWIAAARAWAAAPAEAAYYERNARQLITTWHQPGCALTDYANRQWNGLLATYYLRRWEEYIRRREAALVENKPFDFNAYNKWRVEFEGGWVEAAGENFSARPRGDAVTLARRLYKKYYREMHPSPAAVAGSP